MKLLFLMKNSLFICTQKTQSLFGQSSNNIYNLLPFHRNRLTNTDRQLNSIHNPKKQKSHRQYSFVHLSKKIPATNPRDVRPIRRLFHAEAIRSRFDRAGIRCTRGTREKRTDHRRSRSHERDTASGVPINPRIIETVDRAESISFLVPQETIRGPSACPRSRSSSAGESSYFSRAGYQSIRLRRA